jgi:hypothetical protein
MKISVQYDETDVHALLKQLITHENAEQFINLLTPLICESHKAGDWLFKLHLGKSLPPVLPINTLCYIGLANLAYSANKKGIEEQGLMNPDGFVICKIVEFKGFHGYNEYYVSYTDVDPITEEKKEAKCHVSHYDLTVIDEF